MENSKINVQETLLPALLQCFGIIFIGYILGKTKVLGKNESCGLSIFVQKLSLPALIFVQVSTVAFDTVNWGFIAAVFVAKAIIFISTALVSMLLTHPIHLGKAGLFSIAATQSNDFALGYPLLVSLYHNTHPEYPLYLYIIAPIQLLVLNTVGFFMIETEKKSQTNCKLTKYNFLHVLKDTVLNPVILMTILGLIWNISSNQKVLPVLGPILNAFSSAFTATALILLGYTMSEHNKKNDNHLTLPVVVIILAKNLILPLLLQKCTNFMLKGSTTTTIQSFNCFGFLYGTLPTAPTVYVFASQYCICVDTVTKVIIGSTLLSAPLMFASASVISLSHVGIKNLSHYLNQTISFLSTINIICCIWLIIVFCLEKRWRNVSFGVTLYLVLAQFFMAAGGLILFYVPAEKTLLFYLQYILTNGSIYSTSLCAFLLAILLVIIRIRSLCFILQIKKHINILAAVVCCVVPYALAASLLFTEEYKTDEPIFQLGFPQVVVTFIVRLVCLVGTIICLIVQQIYLRKNSTNSLPKDQNDLHQNRHVQESDKTSVRTHARASCSADIEDLGSLAILNCNECDETLPEQTHSICDDHYHCSTLKRAKCTEQVSQYISENNEIGTGLNDNENFFKHISFLLALSVGMTISVFMCLGKLILEDVSGIFIEIQFLDCIVSYSLGILCFIMFGLDTNLIKTIKRKCINLKRTCFDIKEQMVFKNFQDYYEKCVDSNNKMKVLHGKKYHNIFFMEDIVIWMIESGITKCHSEALFYAKYFLENDLIIEFDAVKKSDKELYMFSNVK